MSTPLWLSQGLMRIRPAPAVVALKRLLRIHREWVQTRRGWFFIDPVSNFGLALRRDGEYEPSMIAALEASLPAGGCFVDLGANEGYFSVIGSALVGPQGRVLAIEPQPRIRPILEENIARNGGANVTIESRAISDSVGSASFHVSPDTNSGSSGLFRTSRYPVPTIQVETARLADVLGSHRIAAVDLLKIDIEGYEHEAVIGSPELFRDGRVRTIAVEIHPRALEMRRKDVSAVPEFLRECGYRPVPTFDSLYRLEGAKSLAHGQANG